MNDHSKPGLQQLILLALAAAVLYFLAGGKLPDAPGPTPNPEPAPVAGFAAVFAENPNRAQASGDLEQLAWLCQSVGECLEYDGRAKNGPRIKTAAQVEDLRTRTRELQLFGVEYAGRYPRWGAAVAEFMRERLGDEDADLTPAEREKQVRAYRALADELAKARAELGK